MRNSYLERCLNLYFSKYLVHPTEILPPQFQKQLEEQITPFQYFFDLLELHSCLEFIDQIAEKRNSLRNFKDQIPKDSTIEQISEILNLVDEDDD